MIPPMTNPSSSGYATALMFGSIFLLALGLLLIFAPDLAGESLAGTGPIMFLAGVITATGYCVIGALARQHDPEPVARPIRTMAAGWYPDGVTVGQERYWDGNAWTEQVRQIQR